MRVHVVAVGVRAGLLSPDSGHPEGAQHDEHEGHRELHGEPHLRRHHQTEERDDTAGQQDREGVPEAPQDPD
jgi:hypothetical protein